MRSELRKSRDVVLEEQVERHPLVCGPWYVPWLNTVAVLVVVEVVHDVFLGVHDGNGEPGFQPADELAADLQVQSRGVPDSIVIAAVGDAHVVDGVRDEMVQILVVGLRREFERSAPQLEVVFCTSHDVERTLRQNVGVECAVGIAHLTVEGGLVV